MPTANKPLTTTIEPAPRINGVTTAARAARAAEERPASEQTLSIMPSAADLAAELRVQSGRFAPAGEEARGQRSEVREDEDDAETETDDEATDETDDSAGDGTEEDTATTDETGTGEQSTEEDDSSLTSDLRPPTSEDDAAEDAETELPPEAAAVRDAMQKRIDKLTAQRTEARERLEELETELEQARQTPPVRSAADPLGHITSETALEAAIAEARNVQRWALQNRDGATVKMADGSEQEFDAARVAEILSNAEIELAAVPQRKEWLGQQGQTRQYAAQIAPEFYQDGTKESQFLKTALKKVPAAVLAWRPDLELILVQALVGSVVLNQRHAKNGKGGGENGAKPPVVSVKKAPAAPAGRTAPKAPAADVAKRQRAQQLKTVAQGNERHLARALEDRLSF